MYFSRCYFQWSPIHFFYWKSHNNNLKAGKNFHNLPWQLFCTFKKWRLVMTEWFNQYFMQRWTSNKVYLFIHYWHWYWASFVHLGCHNNNKIHFEQIYLTGMKIISILLFKNKIVFSFSSSHFFFFSCLHKATTSLWVLVYLSDCFHCELCKNICTPLLRTALVQR